MREENGFSGLESHFFTTSNIGGRGPDVGKGETVLKDAFDLKALTGMDTVITCQGGDYTTKVYPELRKGGWQGYWLDSASTLRMEKESIIVLDPVNRSVIDAGLSSGVKTFIGGNCTVSLMLMALSGLFAQGRVEWVSSMTYQAASGAGANNMKELVSQMAVLTRACGRLLDDPAATAIEIDARITKELRSPAFPAEYFGAPLAA